MDMSTNYSAMEVEQQRRALCDGRAQKIVESLIDKTPDEITLLNQLQWINQTHYQDINEERAISKICGYPLCNIKLHDIPKKKYHVSLVQNKVYDITDRKNFCSDQCYKASTFLKEQLFDSPLWMRDEKEKRLFNLLKTHSCELRGEEISFEISKDRVSRKCETECNSKTPLSKACRESANHESNVKPNNISKCHLRNVIELNNDSSNLDRTIRNRAQTTQNTNKFSEIDEKPIYNAYTLADILPDVSHQNKNVIEEFSRSSLISRFESSKEQKYKEPRSVIKIREAVNSSKTIDKYVKFNKILPPTVLKRINYVTFSENASEFVLHVERSLREWLTVDSLLCIIGSDAMKKLVSEKDPKFKLCGILDINSHFNKQYEIICKKLRIMEIEEEIHQNNVVSSVPTKPVPDYESLKKLTKEMEIKVRVFYQGDKRVTFDDSTSNNEKIDDTPNVLPPLHQYAKNTIRKSIVWDKLKSRVSDLAIIFGIPCFDISQRVMSLISACRFSAHNITFKPLEWRLIALICIYLLALNDKSLQKHLRNKSNYTDVFLTAYQLPINYLDALCQWLMDIDLILDNEKSSKSEYIHIT